MARPLRIELEGAWYHVMNRGAGQREVFASDEQRQGFMDLLGDVRERFGVKTHAFCLMGNHYHLLLHAPQANLPRAMRHIGGVYTQRYNRAVGTDGPLFRGRFRSLVVDVDAYLLAVSRSIHRNPAAAGLVADPIDYPWSSYPAYVGRAVAPPWLERDVVWSALEASDPARAYRQFVERPEATEVDAFHERGDGGAILGSDDFRDTVLAGFTGSERESFPICAVAIPGPSRPRRSSSGWRRYSGYPGKRSPAPGARAGAVPQATPGCRRCTCARPSGRCRSKRSGRPSVSATTAVFPPRSPAIAR